MVHYLCCVASGDGVNVPLNGIHHLPHDADTSLLVARRDLDVDRRHFAAEEPLGKSLRSLPEYLDPVSACYNQQGNFVHIVERGSAASRSGVSMHVHLCKPLPNYTYFASACGVMPPRS